MRITRKMAMLVSGTGLLLGLTVMGAAAAPNATEAVMNDIPATALFVDGTDQTIAGNSSLWYKFDYGVSAGLGEKTLAHLTMLDGMDSGVSFDIYSASQIANWWENNPVGRGTSQSAFGVLSNDLTWDGQFSANGVQYIKVTNRNPGAAVFNLALNNRFDSVGQ
jgi:hypothetical protein